MSSIKYLSPFLHITDAVKVDLGSFPILVAKYPLDGPDGHIIAIHSLPSEAWAKNPS
jgi:hypothetical protein